MSRFLRLLPWLLIALLGMGAVLVAAFQKGEPVNALWLVVAGVCSFSISYRFYSAWLMAKVLTIDELRAPPAITKADGKDFVPSNKWVVFGHHFAAIAGPGPLVGPVLASQFGFLPGTIWILVGATLGGGVHDAVILFASMRREGKSLGQMLKEEVNPFVGIVALISLICIMTILLAVLGLVVVKTLAHSPWGLFTIAMTIPLAMAMGLALRSGKFSVLSVSIVGVIGLMGCVIGGAYLPDGLAQSLTLAPTSLAWAIMAYGFAASVLPVWLLLAPRDYLSTYLKLGTVIVLAVFIIVVAPPLKMPAMTQFVNGGGWVVPGTVFPFVCITIACGAISGFHSLISSGTTPKLLSREKHIRLVGYGAMVTEMLVALSALIAACALEPGQYFAINTPAEPPTVQNQQAAIDKVTKAGFPVTLSEMQNLATEMGEPTLIGKTGGAPTFAVGMAMMFDKVFSGSGFLKFWYHFAIMFEALFILTTLDAGTRVGRFILQDLLGQFHPKLRETSSLTGNILASFLLVAAWGFFLYQGAVDPDGIAKSLWPIFGISNQLLAVIAFCLGTTILIKMGKVRYVWCTAIPLVFLTLVTFTAGYLKLFSAGAAGFIPAAQKLSTDIAIGGLTPAVLATKERALFVARVDIAVTAFFLVMVAIIVVGCLLEWRRLLNGQKKIVLRESPRIALTEKI